MNLEILKTLLYLWIESSQDGLLGSHLLLRYKSMPKIITRSKYSNDLPLLMQEYSYYDYFQDKENRHSNGL
jgi:hypothetical protein